MALRRRNVSAAGAGEHPPAPRGPKVRRKIGGFDTTNTEVGSVITAAADKKRTGVIRFASSGRANYGRLRAGVLSLDLCLAGGLRLSRGSMLYGEKSTGKSTVALLYVAAAQRANPDYVAVWIDIEGTLDLKWAVKLGVDLDRLVVVEPETGEEAVDLADSVMRSREVSIVVTDSIAFLTPMKEIQDSAEDAHMALQARLMGNYLRRVNNAMLVERHREHYPVILHINQFRMKVGIVFGDARTLPGGKALEFSTSQQILMYNKEHVSKAGLVEFNEHEFKITKDKTGGRLKEGVFKLIRDADATGLPEGYIDQTKTILNFGHECGLIDKAGANYTLKTIGNKKLRGEDAATKFFVEDPAASDALQTAILERYRAKWDVE